MKDHVLNELKNTIEKNGIESLLPQNLSRETLDFMIIESETMKNDSQNGVSPHMLILAILHLAENSLPKDVRVAHLSDDDLTNYLTAYMTTLGLEEMRRDGYISIKENHLPTVDNILDLHRNIMFNDLRKHMSSH